jgi:hypothetical protein
VKETEIYGDISSTKELNGGIARVDEHGDVFLDMPDGKVFKLKGGIFHSSIYGSYDGYIDAERVK